MKRFNTTENSLLRLRKVTYEDEELLLRWANDPATRASSFETHHISDEEHHAWFTKMMDDPERIAFILMEDDAPVGQCRIDIEGESAEIDYSIAPDRRGMGYGKLIVALLLDEVHEHYPEISRLIAKVKPKNVASARCFTNNGFEEKYECYEYNLSEWQGTLG